MHVAARCKPFTHILLFFNCRTASGPKDRASANCQRDITCMDLLCAWIGELAALRIVAQPHSLCLCLWESLQTDVAYSMSVVCQSPSSLGRLNPPQSTGGFQNPFKTTRPPMLDSEKPLALPSSELTLTPVFRPTDLRIYLSGSRYHAEYLQATTMSVRTSVPPYKLSADSDIFHHSQWPRSNLERGGGPAKVGGRPRFTWTAQMSLHLIMLIIHTDMKFDDIALALKD